MGGLPPAPPARSSTAELLLLPWPHPEAAPIEVVVGVGQSTFPSLCVPQLHDGIGTLWGTGGGEKGV